MAPLFLQKSERTWGHPFRFFRQIDQYKILSFGQNYHKRKNDVKISETHEKNYGKL